MKIPFPFANRTRVNWAARKLLPIKVQMVIGIRNICSICLHRMKDTNNSILFFMDCPMFSTKHNVVFAYNKQNTHVSYPVEFDRAVVPKVSQTYNPYKKISHREHNAANQHVGRFNYLEKPNFTVVSSTSLVVLTGATICGSK